MPKYSKNFTQNIFEADAEPWPVRSRLSEILCRNILKRDIEASVRKLQKWYLIFNKLHFKMSDEIFGG